MNKRFGFIPIKSQFVESEDALLKIVGNYFKTLEKIGGERWSEDKLDTPLSIFYLIVTGGTEEILLKVREKRNNMIPADTVFFLAHPTHNSLPASLEVLARLQQDGVKGQIFYLNDPDDKNGIAKIEKAALDNEVMQALKKSRIGLVGEPSDWLVASSPSPSIVQKTWGPIVVPIDIKEITQIIEKNKTESITKEFNSLLEETKEVHEPTKIDLENNIRVYLALKQIIKKYELNAITIRCFDLVLDIQTTGCFGLSQLNDEGFIAGCEGDLVSTIGMLWAYKLLNQIPWMANPAQLDEEKNTLWLAHCTVPRSIVRNYDLRSHFESGLGVGIQGEFGKGPVTLLRLGGKKIEKIWLAEGDIIQTGNSEHLCRTQIEIKLTNGHVNDLLSSPLGNHIVLLTGHHAERLESFWEMNVKS
jgi:L-fucose isomerase-like protein